MNIKNVKFVIIAIIIQNNLVFFQLNLSNYWIPIQIKNIIIGNKGNRNLSSLWADKLKINIVNIK